MIERCGNHPIISESLNRQSAIANGRYAPALPSSSASVFSVCGPFSVHTA